MRSKRFNWLMLAWLVASRVACGDDSHRQPLDDALPKIAKIFGAGGLPGLERYQSGIFISGEGHILTAYSYVLDTDDGKVSVVLHDGRSFEGELLGYDPVIEMAVLKIAATDLPHFDLASSVSLSPGARIFALSNLYGIAVGNEPASVLHGSVAAVTTMNGRRGTFDTPYRGPIYVLDAITNNAGAAGGAVIDLNGQLAGVIGKELRSATSNIWLNYAVPIEAIRDSIIDMKAGKSRPRADREQRVIAKNPWSLADMGLLLIPDILPKTPPFVESVVDESPAARAGFRPDDLLIYIEKTMVRSHRELMNELLQFNQDETISLVVLRDNQLVPLTIKPTDRP